MTLTDRILEMLKGRSQHKPLIGDDLLARTGADPDDVSAALDDLQGRGALNRVEITRDGRTFTALWPTGMVPRALSWKTERDLGIGTSAQLAHNLQQEAERSRQAAQAPEPEPNLTGLTNLSGLPTDTPPTKETDMRIARPAHTPAPTPAPTPTPDSIRPQWQRNNGPVQIALMEALREHGEMDAEGAYSELPEGISTLASTKKMLARLHERGVISGRMAYVNHRHRRLYRLPDAPMADHFPPSDPEVAQRPEETSAGLPNLSGLPPARPQADPAPAPAPITHPSPQRSEHATFAFYDDGALEIYQGDDTVMLQPKQLSRLVAFLGRIAA